MHPQTYPLFCRWDGQTWRVIGWEGDDADLNYTPVVVAHNRVIDQTMTIPAGSEYTLLVAVPGASDDSLGESLFEWSVKYRRKSWAQDNAQCNNHYQTRKGCARAAEDVLTGIKWPSGDLDRLSIFRRRCGPWERQPIREYIAPHIEVPAQYLDADPRYLRKHTDA